MKTGFVLLLLIFMSAMFVRPMPAQDQDSQSDQSVERLNYIHFDAVTHSVAWGVSEGTIEENGDFKDSGGPVTTYSLNLETGVLTHNGENGPLTPIEAYDASRILSGLSQLMRGYEQDCPESDDSAPQDPEEESSAAEPSPEIARIADHCKMAHLSNFSRKNGRKSDSVRRDSAIERNFPQPVNHGSDWPAFAGRTSSYSTNRNTTTPLAASYGAFQQRPLSPYFTSELVGGITANSSKACFGPPDVSGIPTPAGQWSTSERSTVESLVTPMFYRAQ